MIESDTATTATKAIQQETSIYARLRGPWLTVVRVLWIIVAVAGVSLYIAAVPFNLSVRNPDCQARPCSPDELLRAAAIRDVGLPGSFVAGYIVLFDSITAALYCATAALILWRRSDDRVALFGSLMLLASGLTFAPVISSLVAAQAALLPALILLQWVGNGFLIAFTFIFPDGRFVPRWTRWVTPIILVALGFILVGAGSHVYYSTLFTCFLMTSGLIGVIAQIYRYRRISTPAQRQQTKWVMLSAAGFLILSFIGLLPGLINPDLRRSIDTTGLIYTMIRVPVFLMLPSLLVPVALAFSMLRYRLWDVDFIINRSLVYGAVTLVLGGLFVGGFFGLRTLLGAVLGSGQDLLGIAVPAVAITALFNPSRTLLRRFIDQRLYGIRLDYLKAVRTAGESKKEATRTGDTATSFGSYSGLTLIGRGGMGEVYRARHLTLNRAVAIKILPPQSAGSKDAKKRFMREAQTVAKLRHSNIITMHDVGEQDGKPYMVMEYIDGRDLSAILEAQGKLPLMEAAPILNDVAAALDYAHGQGVIHRDIKPSNVMIEDVTASGSGQSMRAVLMDFGIAKSYAATSRLTSPGMIGTLDYISPEQIQGAAEVDHRADIYSLGVMAYQMLTGVLPFKHNNPGAMVLAHLNQPPPDPREKAPDLPESAALAVMRAMAKNPDQRPTAAGEFVAALS